MIVKSGNCRGKLDKSILSSPNMKSVIRSDPQFAEYTNVSLPAPPMRVSLPSPPSSVSSPASPVRLSLPISPMRVSLPSPPSIVSSPERPSRRLATDVPVILLFPSEPITFSKLTVCSVQTDVPDIPVVKLISNELPEKL